MYFLSKLSQPSMQFVNIASSTRLNQKRCFSVAVGYVLARQLALPVGEVDDLSSHYRLQHATSVLMELDRLNDVLPFDSKLARRAVEDFYNYRYWAANPPQIPLALRKDHGVVDFFGLSNTIADEVLAEINSCPEQITSLVNNLTAVFIDLQKATGTPSEQEQDRHVA